MHTGKLFQCHMAASCTWYSTYQRSSPSCWTRAIQKSLTFYQKCLRILCRKKKSGETGTGSLVEKRQDRKGKRTRQKKRRDTKGESNDSPEILDSIFIFFSISDIPASLWGKSQVTLQIERITTITDHSPYKTLWERARDLWQNQESATKN